jgi:type II secretion system protein H
MVWMAAKAREPTLATGKMKRAGFTLLELMVVVVLIGLITALIVPEMKGTFQDMLLRSTARDLVSAFSLASSQAITVHQTHRVRMDSSSGHYFVERTARQAEAGGGFTPVSNLPGAKGELDGRIKIMIHKARDEAGENEEERSPFSAPDREQPGQTSALSFYPDGTAEAGEIELRDGEGFGLALRLNATTARVRVIELERK